MSPSSSEEEGVEILRSPLLTLPGILHGWPTRRGGVSTGARASLNLGVRWGDSPENVAENRRRVAVAAGYDPDRLQVTKHVHGVNVFVVGDTLPVGQKDEYDALVTDRRGDVLGAFAADCIPMLFADPARRVVAAAHAGWRGTVSGIAPNVIDVLARRFDSVRANIRVALGPSIGPCCFEVGDEVVGEFRRGIGADVPGLVVDGRGGSLGSAQRGVPATEPQLKKQHIDLRIATRTLLERAGVAPENIDSSPPCTRCGDASKFFSFRRDGMEGGVHMGFIGLA